MHRMLWVLRMAEEGFHRDAPEALAELNRLDAIDGAIWDELLDALALLRSTYAGARGKYTPDPFDLWRVSQFGCSLTWYFRVRQSGDASLAAPAYTTALATVADATGLVGHRGICKHLRGGELERLTADRLVELAGKTKSTASPRLVQLAETLVAGQPRGVGQVPALAGQLDALLLFGASYTSLQRAMWTFFLARRFLYADLAHAMGDTPELHALLDAPSEPSGFEIVEPSFAATVPAPARGAWFTKLAEIAIPLALDSSDAVIREALRRMASAMSEPPTHDRVAHALATYDKLDALFGEMLAFVEYGLRRACHVAATTDPFDAAARDRVIRSPRAYFETLRRARGAA